MFEPSLTQFWQDYRNGKIAYLGTMKKRLSRLREAESASQYAASDPRTTLRNPAIFNSAIPLDKYSRCRWANTHLDVALFSSQVLITLKKQGIPFYVEGARLNKFYLQHMTFADLTESETRYIWHVVQKEARKTNLEIATNGLVTVLTHEKYLDEPPVELNIPAAPSAILRNRGFKLTRNKDPFYGHSEELRELLKPVPPTPEEAKRWATITPMDKNPFFLRVKAKKK